MVGVCHIMCEQATDASRVQLQLSARSYNLRLNKSFKQIHAHVRTAANTFVRGKLKWNANFPGTKSGGGGGENYFGEEVKGNARNVQESARKERMIVFKVKRYWEHNANLMHVRGMAYAKWMVVIRRGYWRQLSYV